MEYSVFFTFQVILVRPVTKEGQTVSVKNKYTQLYFWIVLSQMFFRHLVTMWFSAMTSMCFIVLVQLIKS